MRVSIACRVFCTVLFVILINPVAIYSQNIDSLKRELVSGKADTNRVNTLNELCRAYRTNLPDSSLQFGQASLTLARSLNYGRGISAALNSIGVVYFFKDDYKNARVYQAQALDYASQHGFSTQLANALNSLALINQYEGNYIQALDDYLKSLKIEEANKNNKGIVKIMGNMALLYKVMGDEDNSLSYSLQAFALNETLKNPERVRASLANNIGLVYVKKKKYEEALNYLQINLHVGRTLNDKLMIVNALSNIGYCHLSLNEDVSIAAPFIKEAYILLPGVTSQAIKTLVLLNMGALDLRQGYIEEAIGYFYQSLAISQSIKFAERNLECYRALAEAYYQQGNFKKGYEFNDRAYTLNDSLRNAEIFDKVIHIQKSYELSKSQAEVDHLSSEARIEKLETEKQKNLIYFLIVALFFVALIAGAIYFGLRAKARLNRALEIKNREIQHLNLTLEIKALRSQMDPHFVFNALNGLQHFLITQNTKESISYLSKVARFIRLTLQNSSRDWVKISEEIEILQLYLQVEQYRFPGKFDFEFRLDAAIGNEKIPFLVIQPYVENAVLHGLVPRKLPGGRLIITASQEGSTIRIAVEDNGVGRGAFVQKVDPMFTSMGSGLVRERLQKLSQQLGTVLKGTIEDLFDAHGKPAGTRSLLVFEMQPTPNAK